MNPSYNCIITEAKVSIYSGQRDERGLEKMNDEERRD